MLGAHCQLALGGVLSTAGRWEEAERAVRGLLDDGSGSTASQRHEAMARLAELWIRAGRVDDAAELLGPVEDHPAAALPLALVWMSRGQPRLAAAAARRGIEALSGDILRQSSLLSLLVQADLAAGDAGSAGDAAARLQSLAVAADAPVVAALADVAAARLALHRTSSDEATTLLQRARSIFSANDRPLDRAEVDLLAAEALRASAPDDAIAAARSAHATADRLGADHLRDHGAALLRSLGASPPRSRRQRDALGELSAREADILDGIRRGETNAQLATRLFISRKTVERHVGNLFAKLGVRSRAEAASVAASLDPR